MINRTLPRAAYWQEENLESRHLESRSVFALVFEDIGGGGGGRGPKIRDIAQKFYCPGYGESFSSFANNASARREAALRNIETRHRADGWLSLLNPERATQRRGAARRGPKRGLSNDSAQGMIWPGSTQPFSLAGTSV